MRRLDKVVCDMPADRNVQGFTIIELVVAITIIGIVMVFSTYSLMSSNRAAELRAAAQELYGQFQRAKMEAIKRNENVVILFDTSGTPNFYQVFVDPNDDDVFNAGDELLAEVVLADALEFSSITFSDDKMAYTPRGRPSGGSGSVDLTSTSTGKTFKLTTSIAGYVHLE